MEFFTRQWVEGFAQKWNRDAEMTGPLAEIGFTAIIGFGYPNSPDPSVLLEVKDGKVARAGLFNKLSQPAAIDWDLRALPEQWVMWQTKPLSLSTVSVAVQNQQLQFKTGDYRKMIRTHALANPFFRFFKIL